MTAWANDFSVFGVPLAFLWTALIVELTPGPNMTYLAVLSLSEGRRAGFAAVGGVAAGLAIVALLAAFGLATIISQSPFLYHALRWIGVGYLLWLAYEIWRGESTSEDAFTSSLTLGRYFRRGLMTNLLNPKAAIFYIAVLPPFLDPSKPVLAQTLAMSIAYVLIATGVHFCVVVIAERAKPWLTDGRDVKTVRGALSLSVIMVAAWLIWSTRTTLP